MLTTLWWQNILTDTAEQNKKHTHFRPMEMFPKRTQSATRPAAQNSRMSVDSTWSEVWGNLDPIFCRFSGARRYNFCLSGGNWGQREKQWTGSKDNIHLALRCSSQIFRQLYVAPDVEEHVRLTLCHRLLITGCHHAVIEMIPQTWNNGKHK